MPGSADDFARAALGYLGTPYRRGGREPGGVDCIGLVICAARDSGWPVDDMDIPAHYRADGSSPELLAACTRHMRRVQGPPRRGDVGLFRESAAAHPHHLAVFTSPTEVVQASARDRGVRLRRFRRDDGYVGLFALPGVDRG